MGVQREIVEGVKVGVDYGAVVVRVIELKGRNIVICNAQLEHRLRWGLGGKLYGK